MATNQEVLDWYEEASGEGYSPDTYQSRLSNLQDRYTQAGVTDDQLRGVVGRNAYDDWVNKVKTGYSSADTGWGVDMDPFDWALDSGYQNATGYEGWTDEELYDYWEAIDTEIDKTRQDSMNWLEGKQTAVISPSEITEQFLLDYKARRPEAYDAGYSAFLSAPGSDLFTEEESDKWISDWINKNDPGFFTTGEDYTVKPGEVGLLSDRLNTVLTGQGMPGYRYIDSSGNFIDGNSLSEIEKLYQDIAGRTAEAKGLAYWESTGLRGAELEAAFRSSVKNSDGEAAKKLIASGESLAVPSASNDGVSMYLDRARLQANEQMGSQGLLNSSMAAGAAEGAAIDRAMPIAQGDVDVDKFNVGAQTAADTARYNAAKGIAGSTQEALNSMSLVGANFVSQQLLNKQLHGMNLTEKEQDQLNRLQEVEEAAKDAAELAKKAHEDLMEGKSADFGYETLKASQKNYYDVLNKELKFELDKLNSSAQMAHEATLAIMKEGSVLYQGYMDGMSNILASNLTAAAKESQLAILTSQFNAAITSNESYGDVKYGGTGGISFEDYYDNYDAEGVLGTEAITKRINTEDYVPPNVSYTPPPVDNTITDSPNFGDGTGGDWEAVNNVPSSNTEYRDSNNNIVAAGSLSEVERLYQDYAGRTADAGGLAYWESTGLTGQALEDKFKEAVANSDGVAAAALVAAGSSYVTDDNLYRGGTTPTAPTDTSQITGGYPPAGTEVDPAGSIGGGSILTSNGDGTYTNSSGQQVDEYGQSLSDTSASSPETKALFESWKTDYPEQWEAGLANFELYNTGGLTPTESLKLAEILAYQQGIPVDNVVDSDWTSLDNGGSYIATYTSKGYIYVFDIPESARLTQLEVETTIAGLERDGQFDTAMADYIRLMQKYLPHMDPVDVPAESDTRQYMLRIIKSRYETGYYS